MVLTTKKLLRNPKSRKNSTKSCSQILSPTIYDAHIRPKGTGGTNVTKGADDGELPINASVIFFRVMMMMVMMTIMTMMVMMMIKKKALYPVLWIPDVTFQEPLWSG